MTKHIKRTNRYGDIVTFLARLILGLSFLVYAIKEVLDFKPLTQRLIEIGFFAPEFFLALGIFVQMTSGFSLLIGFKGKFNAFILALFTILATFTFHFPTYIEEIGFFSKDLMIFAGLLFISAFGPGRVSLDYKLYKRNLRKRR